MQSVKFAKTNLFLIKMNYLCTSKAKPFAIVGHS